MAICRQVNLPCLRVLSQGKFGPETHIMPQRSQQQLQLGMALAPQVHFPPANEQGLSRKNFFFFLHKH